MQNWNQWQLPAGTVAGTMSQPPTAPAYPAPGADPMATMQAYMQYFNQPAPSGYTAEQWATAQQQNWAQWQQWQQQYQQWQAQYGAKYQETVKQMSASGVTGFPAMPTIQPPPLPKEDLSAKPPLPPDNANSYQPLPHQNNLPLYPMKTSGNPPLPPGQPPPPPDNPPPNESDMTGIKRAASTDLTSDSAKKSKNEDDELSHAEKTFDAQFKQWEEQFNKWKQQNANHPDKAQYKQYEAKWTSWREKLIERREQMRKKREAQRAKAEAEKKKSLPGGEKLLNILTNTENQGLINNLLGIGKTLGLSGKEASPSQVSQAPSMGGMPLSTATSMSMQSTTQSAIPGVPTTMTSDMTQQAWAAQQWAAQYNLASMAPPAFPGYQASAVAPPTMPNLPMILPNLQGFNQPPLGASTNTGVNFSQPPPGFSMNSQSINTQAPSGPVGNRDTNAPFRRDDEMSNFNMKEPWEQSYNDRFGSDRFGPNNRRGPDCDRMGQFRSNDPYDRDGPNRQFNKDDQNDFSGDRFRRDGPSGRGPSNDFRSGDLGPRDRLSDRPFDDDRFGRDEGRFKDQDRYGGPDSGGRDTFNMNYDRGGSGPNDRGGPGPNDRRGLDDRFGLGNDRFNDDRFGDDRFGADRSGTDRSMSGDRFGPDRLGSTSNRFDLRDSMDKKDDYGQSNRNFGGNNRFESTENMSPELKKLMEKRRSAMDVFKPSSSFLGPEKSTTSFGSLSESFKKITGDSPFLPRDRPGDFGRDRGPPFDNARGPQPFGGPGGPENRFRDDFRPRGLGDFDTRIDAMGPRGSNDFGPRGGNFGPRGPGPDFGRPRNFGENMTRPRPPSRDNRSPLAPQGLDRQPPAAEGRDKMREPIAEPQQNIPPLDMPPWMDPQILQNAMGVDERPVVPDNAAVTKETEKLSGPEAYDKPPIIQDNEPREVVKKSDVLPFMGENDPKPEDLNMEPPPELPDLGPIKGPDNMSFDSRRPGSPFDHPNFFDGPFGPRGMPFKPRGPGPFGPRGLEDDRFPPMSGPFGPRGMNNPRGNAPGPLQSLRGPHDGSFGMRDFNEPPFSARGSNDGPFGPRGPSDEPFGHKGLNSIAFGPRGGPEDRFGPREPNQAPSGPRGPDNFGSRGPNVPFGSRGFNDRPFGPQGLEEPFGPLRGPNEQSFGPKLGPSDGPRSNIPSLLSFKFDGPGINRNEPREEMMDMDPPQDRPFDRPFRGEGNRPPFNANTIDGPKPPMQVDRDLKMRPAFPGNEFQTSNNKLGAPLAPGDRSPPCGPIDRPFHQPDAMNIPQPLLGPKPIGPEEHLPEFNEPQPDDDRDPFSRRPGNQPGHRRTGPMRPQFCIEKQFNYNHGGGAPDEIFNDFVPSKVIEYGHIRRPIAQDYVTPRECFDYVHGKAKPIVPDHEIYPRMNFKHWVENEHNLKEYDEGLQAYEDQKRRLKALERRSRRDTSPKWRYEERRRMDDHRSPWEGRGVKLWRDAPPNFRDMRDYKEPKEFRDNRERRERDRSWEKDNKKHREERTHRSNSEDRTREKSNRTRKDSNSEYNKDDERSKGNISRQENPTNNPTESTIQESSKQDDRNTEAGSGNSFEDVSPPRTMELSKISNFTMVDDLLCSPSRQNRPPKIAIILRGPPGSGKSFVAKLIKDKELEQGGSAPRILSLDDYFLTEKEVESKDDNGKKIINKEMIYEYEEAMETSYIASLVKAFKKNITDGFFNFIILDCINEKIADYEEMWSFAKSKGFRVFVCEMEMDVQICLKRNIHKRTEDEINRIVDYFEPTPNYHQKLDVSSLLQEQAIEEVQMEEAETTPGGAKVNDTNDDSQDSQEEQTDSVGVSKWEKMEAEDKLDRLDGLAKRKNEGKPQTMEDFLQVPDYYNMEDTSGKKRVRWADLEERKEQEKMRAVGFVVGQTNWNRMMDPTKGSSALTRTKFFNLT